MARTRRYLLSLLAVPLAFMLMGAAVLVDPAPIPVPAGLAAKEVSKAIRAGIVQRGWEVTKDENGRIDAVLHLRGHMAEIAIDYDTKQVKVSYVASENLDYSDKGGVRHIHRNYNKWVENVVSDISRQLQVASIGHE